MFNDQQKAELAKPLDRANVRSREQAGRTLSYLEGWRAIAEANRIFGFDGWDSETVDIRMVAETQRKIGKAQRDGWSVSYTAKVRVTVAGNIREGIGAGHGMDVDLGLAHESAIKESETDARKRALMTFGNQFGLALYDKEQTNVVDVPPEPDVSMLISAEKSLEASARLGMKSLGDSWRSLPETTRSALGGKCPERFKAIAAEYDSAKAAA